MSELKIGAKYTKSKIVAEADLASAVGNPGVHVFSTPSMILFIELTTGEYLATTQPEEAGSVGTHVDVRHLAATPVGMEVRCDVEVIEVDRLRVVFDVELFDEVEKIGSGRHERFIVPNLPQFLSRAMQKGK